MMDSALKKILPSFTGFESLADVVMQYDIQTIKANIDDTDTDSLLVVFKALGFYIGQGGDPGILGELQHYTLEILKVRFS